MFDRRIAWAVVAGLAFASGLPPRELALAAFVYAPLLALAIEGESPRRAAGLGFLSGVVFLVPATHWVARAASDFGQVPFAIGVAAEVSLVVVQACTPAAAAFVASHAAARGAKLGLALPATLALAFAFFPAIMPWHPGFLAVPWLDYVQCLDLGGIVLVDLLVGLAGCAILELARRRNVASIAIAMLTIAAPLVYGIPRRHAVELRRSHAETLHVGIAQPNVSIALGRDSDGAPARLARMHRLERVLVAHGAELILFPESTYPHPVRRVAAHDVPPPHGILAEGLRVPVVAGALTTAGRCETRNTLLALDESGTVVGRADKLRPFPFADEIPAWDFLPFLHARFPCRGLARAGRASLLEVARTKLGALVCYDSVDAWPARALVLEGAELLSEHTNDAWYGHSDELHMHARVGRLRAIETRRDLVRVTNTGFSEHVASSGRIVARLLPFRETSGVVHAAKLRGRSLYVAFGDAPALVLALAVLALAFVRPRAPRASTAKG